MTTDAESRSKEKEQTTPASSTFTVETGLGNLENGQTTPESPTILVETAFGKEQTTSESPTILVETGLGQLELDVYSRRWLILAQFSLLGALQAGVWNQWGPLAEVSEQVYGWTDGVIALYANWGPITFIPTALLWSWLVDTKGLRVSCVLASGLIAAGTGLRCLDQTPSTFIWLVHACQILNGFAGPIAMGGPPKLSSVWFPPNERATASAVSYVTASLGIGLTFLMGPVVASGASSLNNCTHTNGSSSVQVLTNQTSQCSGDVLSTQQNRIMYYMYGTFGVCAALFLSMLVSFPKEPPKPPSPSASTPRLNYLAGLKQLFRRGRFWQISLAYGLSLGTRDAWSSMLDVNLKAHGISQSDAGWLGFYSILAGVVSGIISGRFADRFQSRFKVLLLLLNTCVLAAFTWFVLLLLDYIPESRGSLYAASILSAMGGAALSPLYYELVCETAYPVSEGITNITLTSMDNVAALICLGVLSIPNTGTVWMNWLLVGSFGMALIMLALLPEGHNRLDIDRKGEELGAPGDSHKK